MRRAMLIAAAFWAAGGGTAWPLDQIYTSTAERPYNGKIVSTTATSITFESLLKGPAEISANEITRIIFDNSPESLLSAQKFMLDGKYEKAIDALDKETGEEKRREVAEEIAFCRAYCMAQLVPSGAADATEAGKQMDEFISKYTNSFHNFKACELLGDIFVTLGRFADAEKYYSMLNQAPWPDYKIRAQVALGRS